ncbi:ricin-type beta-trefoil lectin domain protein [Micromonospora sp. NPDC049903]|uniref:ricin-type beta-trefoil lectin domain protein n=1 Tax=Micromonospora sp. NPDC049903 TaxID=3364276 RepID=UPI0037933FDD
MEPVRPSARPRLGTFSRRAVAGGIAGLAALCAVAAAVGWGVASDRDEPTGRPVSDEHLTAIQAAARSCPVLTPSRIAGQLMAESGMRSTATGTASGGEGIAGLDSEAWRSWAPWPNARRSDTTANVMALAHHMCDLSGHIRVSRVDGDAWRLSLAAYHTGLDDVRDSGGIPPSAVEYVDLVSGYSAYYDRLPAFGRSDESGPSPDRQPPKAVPADLVRLVVRAGTICPQVPPAAVAAQVMALSGFDPNLLGADGRRGIAQFLPEVWQEYGPTAASVWEPRVAIPALGATMCAMRTELAGIEGDPYLLALAAYRGGPASVRQTGGELDRTTQAFLRTVREHTEYYELDSRLAVKVRTTSPAPSLSPSPTGSPSASGSPSPEPSDPSSPDADPDSPSPRPSASPSRTRDETPVATPPTRPSGAKQLVGMETGLCVTAGTSDGVRAKLERCRETQSQWWTFRSDGSVRANGLCLDVAWGERKDGTPVQVALCSGNPAQKWEWIESNGRRSLFNRDTDRCLDVEGHSAGAPMMSWICVFNPKQTFTLK